MEALANRRVVSARGLAYLAHHTYKAGSYTVLDTVLNAAVWNPVAEALPPWLAPNAITLAGTAVIVATAVLFAATAGTGTAAGDVPAWVHLVAAAAHFVYQTLDAVDGKQARRTRNSSPLGQLFDHGCDALTTTIVVYNVLQAIGLGHSGVAACLYATVLTVFFAAQWEESVTRVLRTNAGGLGVSEAQLIMLGVHLAAAALPASFWSTDVSATLSFGATPLVALAGVPLNILSAYIMIAIVAGVGIAFLYNIAFPTAAHAAALSVDAAAVAAAGCDGDGAPHHHHHRRAFSWYTFTRGTSTAILAVTFLFLFSPAAAAAGVTVAVTHPRLVFALYAAAQTALTTRMIVYSMAHEKFPAVQRTALVLPVVAAIAAFHPAAAAPALYAGAVVVAASYLSFAASACRQIADHLGIHTLTINPPRPAPTPVEAPATVVAAAAGTPATPAHAAPATPAPAPAPLTPAQVAAIETAAASVVATEGGGSTGRVDIGGSGQPHYLAATAASRSRATTPRRRRPDASPAPAPSRGGSRAPSAARTATRRAAASPRR